MDTLMRNGDKAPDFSLPDLKDKHHSLNNFDGWIRVLYFWSAECTWCERVDQNVTRSLEAWKDTTKVLWIASNANETRDLIGRVASERNIPNVLLDNNQTVADLYGVQTTPHFFVIDRGGSLVYQGAWDDITFRKRVATQVYVPQVVESLIQGVNPAITRTPPYGCALVRFTQSGSSSS